MAEKLSMDCTELGRNLLESQNTGFRVNKTRDHNILGKTETKLSIMRLVNCHDKRKTPDRWSNYKSLLHKSNQTETRLTATATRCSMDYQNKTSW